MFVFVVVVVVVVVVQACGGQIVLTSSICLTLDWLGESGEQ